jgi:hypothetical protein
VSDGVADALALVLADADSEALWDAEADCDAEVPKSPLVDDSVGVRDCDVKVDEVLIVSDGVGEFVVMWERFVSDAEGDVDKLDACVSGVMSMMTNRSTVIMVLLVPSWTF